MPRSDGRRRFDLIDPGSGELIRVVEDRTDAAAKRAATRKTGKNWMRIYTDELHRLRDLTGTDRRVLDELTDQAAQNGPFGYSVKEIAEAVGTAPPNVSVALRHLRDAGIVIPLGRNEAIIDPRLMWRGSDAEREQWLTDLGRAGKLTHTAPNPKDTPTP